MEHREDSDDSPRLKVRVCEYDDDNYRKESKYRGMENRQVPSRWVTTEKDIIKLMTRYPNCRECIASAHAGSSRMAM